jgi:hypothetical protein
MDLPSSAVPYDTADNWFWEYGMRQWHRSAAVGLFIEAFVPLVCPDIVFDFSMGNGG